LEIGRKPNPKVSEEEEGVLRSLFFLIFVALAIKRLSDEEVSEFFSFITLLD